jgi:hypothetical protein
MNDKKLSEISTNVYKRIKKLVYDSNSEEYQSVIKTRSESVWFLLQWILGIVD